MTATDPASLHQERARLRRTGAIVLAAGIAIAGFIYWRGMRADDSRLDEFSQTQARAQERQMGIMYGRSGVMAEDLTEALKRPQTQAELIAGISALIAAGCFYLGRSSGSESPSPGKSS